MSKIRFSSLPLFALLPLLGFGILLAWLFLRSGSLLVPILVHFLHNALTLGLALSTSW